jgi:hypothetical protein
MSSFEQKPASRQKGNNSGVGEKPVKNDALESALFWLSWVKTGKFWAGVLVAIGIAGEIIGDRIAAPLEKTIDDAKATQIARLENEASEATARAAQANLELAKLKAPRTLTSEQRQRLMIALKSFGGMPIFVRTNPDDAEAVYLTEQLIDVLRQSKFDVQIWRNNSDGRFPSGIIIQVDVKADANTRKAADALIAALREDGLGTIGPDPFEIGNPTALIRLWVGSKPR